MRAVSHSIQIIFAESVLPKIKLLKNSIRDTLELVKYHSHVVTQEREFCWKSNLQPQIAIVQITGYGLQITGYKTLVTMVCRLFAGSNLRRKKDVGAISDSDRNQVLSVAAAR